MMSYYNWKMKLNCIRMRVNCSTFFSSFFNKIGVANWKVKDRRTKFAMKSIREVCSLAPFPMYFRDREGVLLACNDLYLEALGVKFESVVNKNLAEAEFLSFNASHALLAHDEYLRVMDEDRPCLVERTFQVNEDESITCCFFLKPFKDSGGAVLGVIGGWIDLSERQRHIVELIDSKSKADEANRAKTEFLTTISHEIRTPLNAVVGMLELSLKKADRGIVDRFSIKVAYDAALELLDLIGDVLDISRIESGRLALKLGRAKIKDLVESVLQVFEISIRHKGLDLRVSYEMDQQVEVLVDPMRFKQIVSNLLSNAIKFTEIGEISLVITSAQDLTSNNLSLCIVVSDTGVGISEADQVFLFNPYVQADNAKQSNQRGSGLGLVICKTLCEIMQGSLELSSEVGQGTRVEVKLNLPILHGTPDVRISSPEIRPQSRKLNILVVDDHLANRVLLSHQLSYLGHNVKEAEGGVQGLHELSCARYDAVITDCNMPLINGYELTRGLREMELLEGHGGCLVVGITANAQAEEKARCLESGMDACLFKPASLKDLSTVLEINTDQIITAFAGGEIITDTQDSGVNIFSLKKLVGNDEAVLRNLLNELKRCNEEDILRLSNLFEGCDLAKLSDLAHHIKGGARMVGARGVILCCESVELACSGYDSIKLFNAVEELKKSMEELNNEVDGYF